MPTPDSRPAPSAWMIDYDHREPGGPHHVGPFPTRAAADSWNDAAQLDVASFSIVPMHLPPVGRPLPDVDHIRDVAIPDAIFTPASNLLLAASMATLVVQGFSLVGESLAEGDGQKMLVLEFEGRVNKSNELRAESIAIPADQTPHLMGLLLNSCAAAGVDPDEFLEVLSRGLSGFGA